MIGSKHIGQVFDLSPGEFIDGRFLLTRGVVAMTMMAYFPDERMQQEHIVQVKQFF